MIVRYFNQYSKMIGILLAYLATVVLFSKLIEYGSRGCFCDIILRDGTQARLLNVDAEDILLLAESEGIDIMQVDGPTIINLLCFLSQLTFTILARKVFGKRKRSVASPDGDNWRVGLP